MFYFTCNASRIYESFTFFKCYNKKILFHYILIFFRCTCMLSIMSLINLLVQIIFWRRKVTFMSKYLWSRYSYSTPAELQLCLPVFRWCSRADSAPLWSELTVLGRWCSYEAQDLCILNRTHHKTHTYSPVPVERSQQISCDNIHKKGKNWLVG